MGLRPYAAEFAGVSLASLDGDGSRRAEPGSAAA
jgi:hypothetical protein